MVAAPAVLWALNKDKRNSLTRTQFGGNNPHFPSMSGSSHAHLGHVTVRRDLGVRFPDMTHGEDGWFAAEALHARLRVIYVAADLSIYEPLSPRNLLLAMTSRAKHVLKRRWVGVPGAGGPP